MILQALTPEQSKMFWTAASEVGKWAVSGLTLAIVAHIGKKIRELPGKIVAPVNARLDEHESRDDERFRAIEAHLHIKPRHVAGGTIRSV